MPHGAGCFALALDQAAILPRIVALGDIDEDEIIFAEASGDIAEAALALPPAIGPLERRLLLAQLIVRWAEKIRPDKGAPLIANTPAAALALADDLARLIDDVITREVDWKKLDELVPDQFDKYWQLTLDFLKIARGYWPERLAEIGAIDASRRRDLLIDAEMKRLAGSRDPVIAAGSTGLDAGNCKTARDDRTTSARRGRIAGPRHRSRRSFLARARRQRGRKRRARLRASTILHAGAACAHRHRARGRRTTSPIPNRTGGRC